MSVESDKDRGPGLGSALLSAIGLAVVSVGVVGLSEDMMTILKRVDYTGTVDSVIETLGRGNIYTYAPWVVIAGAALFYLSLIRKK